MTVRTGGIRVPGDRFPRTSKVLGIVLLLALAGPPPVQAQDAAGASDEPAEGTLILEPGTMIEPPSSILLPPAGGVRVPPLLLEKTGGDGKTPGGSPGVRVPPILPGRDPGGSTPDPDPDPDPASAKTPPGDPGVREPLGARVDRSGSTFGQIATPLQRPAPAGSSEPDPAQVPGTGAGTVEVLDESTPDPAVVTSSPSPPAVPEGTRTLMIQAGEGPPRAYEVPAGVEGTPTPWTEDPSLDDLNEVEPPAPPRPPPTAPETSGQPGATPAAAGGARFVPNRYGIQPYTLTDDEIRALMEPMIDSAVADENGKTPDGLMINRYGQRLGRSQAATLSAAMKPDYDHYEFWLGRRPEIRTALNGIAKARQGQVLTGSAAGGAPVNPESVSGGVAR